MLKDVTILTFDEMEKIRQDLENMIINAKRGANGEDDAKVTCDWLVEDLKNFKSYFE